jgi:RNA polymerase sigma-70 factor (ECF subfamily)
MATLARIRPPLSEAAPEDRDPDALLVAFAKTEPGAFAHLYRRYVDPIYRYCYRRLGTREAAEDVTALIFTKALSALSAYRADGPSFRSWLFAIAHNAVADDLRVRRPVAPLAAALDQADPMPTPESAALAAEGGRRVRDLLRQLPPEQAQIVELRLAGLTGVEIALALGRTPNAVKVAQYRAYSRLRALVGDREPRPGEASDAVW